VRRRGHEPAGAAALAADLADETMLYVGQAKVIGPLIGIDGDAVATAEVFYAGSPNPAYTPPRETYTTSITV
jgi:hypothetical protein